MKKALLLFFILTSVLSYGQKSKNKGPNFDIADFNKKFEVAKWLFKYDLVAWWTTDSAMVQDTNEIKRLGTEWFCFQDQYDTWHAVYGKYSDGEFDLVFHFTVDSTSKVKRTYEKVDTLLLNSYSRALITAIKEMSARPDTISIRCNQYIKQNEDKTFSVWLFPAFQTNGTAVYGGEFVYTIDQSGNKVLKDDSYFQGNYRGFKTDNPREIWLNYREIDKPTLGGIFFVWYYKSYFTKIVLDTKKSKSTLFQFEDKTYYWVHAEKEKEKKKKSK